MAPTRVIFVCAGNTCRSPLAAALADRLIGGAGVPVVVASAGLAADAGQPAAQEAQGVARAMGLDLSTHRSRRVEELTRGHNDLWLTMTPAQAAELRARLGGDAVVEALLPFARRSGAVLPESDVVPDPLGQGPEAYAAVARTLEGALSAIASAWRRVSASDASPAQPQTKTLALPRLTGLRPTLESTALKLLEEAGELAEGIGKYRALSGERRADPPHRVMTAIGQELLDVAQTAITMMFVLEEQYGVDLQGLLHEHIRKLAAKGYLSPAGDRDTSDARQTSPIPPEAL